jgi:hypothetical protein
MEFFLKGFNPLKIKTKFKLDLFLVFLFQHPLGIWTHLQKVICSFWRYRSDYKVWKFLEPWKYPFPILQFGSVWIELDNHLKKFTRPRLLQQCSSVPIWARGRLDLRPTRLTAFSTPRVRLEQSLVAAPRPPAPAVRLHPSFSCPGIAPHPCALDTWSAVSSSNPVSPRTRLLPIPHPAATIRSPLCTEGRRWVTVSPVPPVAIPVHHCCPESSLILVSSCVAAMCLRSTAVASAACLTVEHHLRSSSCPTATSSRTAPSHCCFSDPKPATLDPIPCHRSHASPPESRPYGELHTVSPFESASRALVNFGVLNDNLIKGLILCVKYLSRF